MLCLSNGERIIVELDEWINKLIGRASIKMIKVVDEDEILISEGDYIFFKGIRSLQELYPWADFQIDEDFYDDEDEENFLVTHGIWDNEEKDYVGTTIDFSEYKASLSKIRPIESGGGEIHYYRLVLTLNSLGKSFLHLDHYLELGRQLEIEFD